MQITLEGQRSIDFKTEQSLTIIKRALDLKGETPLIVNYSGGKDSTVLLDIVKQVTDDFLCCFMSSRMEIEGVLERTIKTCDRQNLELFVSYPEDYKGGFDERIAKFRRFPKVTGPWCSRDLKVRPMHKCLVKRFGKQTFYKLNGVRRFESTRRNIMHRNTAKQGFIKKDYDVPNAWMVFPILNWTDEDIKDYIKDRQLELPTKLMYEKFGVSGCLWCLFYQSSIYRRILENNPCALDKYIAWEYALNEPSILGHKWLRDLKKDVQCQQRERGNSEYYFLGEKI